MEKVNESDIVTVAAIRKKRGAKVTEYLFNERAAIYGVRHSLRSARSMSSALGAAQKSGLPVKVHLDGTRGYVKKVEPVSPEEEEEYRALSRPLKKADRVRRVDVQKIDHLAFNLVGPVLKSRTLASAGRNVPSFAKARAIFDYCAAQSCHLSEPAKISPCIPFQYVRDGCYARAHKMRWIIENKFKYGCSKVFSFANAGDDTLAVTASKWGGCCVRWWYHVAPLIQVDVKKIVTQAMVIDPGMFDEPVLLSTWLAAQENKGCSANAKVSMHTIQPGAAYAPANYEGTLFTNDPDYAKTDQTLIRYKGLVTCP